MASHKKVSRKKISEAVGRIVDKMGAEALDILDKKVAETFAEATLTDNALSTLEFKPSITLNDLDDTVWEIRKLGPAPLAIWLIDRPEYLIEIEKLCAKVEPPKTALGYLSYSLGLKIHNYTIEEILQDIANAAKRCIKNGYPSEEIPDVMHKFFPFRRPGIFVQMSDGNHIKIKLP